MKLSQEAEAAIADPLPPKVHSDPRSWPRRDQFSTAMRKGILTDKQIDKYVKSGFYDRRAWYRSELKKQKAGKEVMKRLIYDCEKQDFI